MNNSICGKDVTIGHYVNTMTYFSVPISYHLVAPLVLKSKKMLEILKVLYWWVMKVKSITGK